MMRAEFDHRILGPCLNGQARGENAAGSVTLTELPSMWSQRPPPPPKSRRMMPPWRSVSWVARRAAQLEPPSSPRNSAPESQAAPRERVGATPSRALLGVALPLLRVVNRFVEGLRLGTPPHP